MFTRNYKGMYIHGFLDREQCRVTGYSIDPKKEFKSYRAAQLAISIACKAHDKTMAQSLKFERQAA